MVIIMNYNCCCLLPGQVCSATLQTPANGNHVAVIAESPTEAAVDLDMPLVGKTGVNVCRLFEFLKGRDPERYKQFCLRRALILNASLKKVNGKLEPNGDYDFNQMKDYLRKVKIVICVGERAIDEYLELKGELLKKPETEIGLCHLGARGLAGLSKWHPKEDDAKKPITVPERTKMELIAEWVDNCCKGKGAYGIGQFEACYSKRIEEVIKMSRSCRR